MIRSARMRALCACSGLAFCFTGFSYRLVHLQVCEHEKYAQLAADKHMTKIVLPAQRGTIQDINQEILADNEPLKTVVVDGSHICDPNVLADLLASPLHMPRSDLEKTLQTDRRYLILKKHVSLADAGEITKLLAAAAADANKKVEGATAADKERATALIEQAKLAVTFEPDSIRVYPNGPLLCHVIGFTNAQHQGVQGIEKVLDNYLTGSEGQRYIEHDRTGKEIVAYRGLDHPPTNGSSVRLTIDMGLQNIVETEVDTAVKQFKPKKVIVIMMRPRTGEVLAMSNRPNFDLNEVGDGEPDEMQNAAIIDMFEPGSTFKIVTAAAALNEKVFKHDDMIFCENGSFAFGGRTLHDHHPYGEMTIDDILMKSSNIGAAKMAMRLGDQKFYEYIRRFGFGERTGIALPGEIPGVVHPPHRWTKISITRIPMGQEVAVTPLQTITAMSAIANGGHLMMPQIVHEIVDDQGVTKVNYPPQEIRQVISSETAKTVRDALKTVVTAKGTAALAKVSGFQVAGKTGTAQKVDPKGTGYLPGKYIVSFVGFLPADNPEFACLVMLDDAQTKTDQNYGGTVAAPIFSRIAEKAARYLNLTPEPEEPSSNMILTQSRPERD